MFDARMAAHAGGVRCRNILHYAVRGSQALPDYSCPRAFGKLCRGFYSWLIISCSSTPLLCWSSLITSYLQRILKVDYHIPSHIKLSPEGHDLLKRVLVADPSQRINIQQVRKWEA